MKTCAILLRVQDLKFCRDGEARLHPLLTKEDQLWERGLHIFCLLPQNTTDSGRLMSAELSQSREKRTNMKKDQLEEKLV